MILEKNQFIENYNLKKMIYVNDIKQTLEHYHLNFDKNSKKNELKNILFKFFNSKPQLDNIKEKIVIKIQRLFRKKLLASFANQEDFYTLDLLENLNPRFLFWFTDPKGFKYAFDIRSFIKLIESGNTNPYNREKIPINAICRAHEIIKKRKISTNFNDKEFLTEEQEHRLHIFSVFQKIDMLNVAAGGVDYKWFTNLNFVKLKNYYKVLEDIWNYRAELTHEQKNKIDPNNKLFRINMNYIISLPYSQTNKIKLQKITLNEIDTMISSAHEDTDKYTGCYYTLIGLTEVSLEAANALPWLVQY